jgi:2-oxoglutarate dehydrogenase E2 component (dihydrolipoamide succinyltransferase)
MAVEVRVPVLGESVLEATVGKWLKAEGDAVAIGDPLVELETEKVAVEVAAEADGTLERIVHAQGETVHVGDVLGMLGNGTAPAAAPSESTARTSPPPASTEANPELTPAATPPAGEPPATPPPTEARAPASPSARRQAAAAGVDLSQLAGSGPQGRITRQDVVETRSTLAQAGGTAAPVVEERPPAPIAAPKTAVVAPVSQPGPPREERRRLSRRRLTIARRLVEAQQTAAILTTFNDVDMTAVIEVRQRRRESFRERHGVGLGFMSFFTKAAIGALKAFPQLNAELRGDELVLKHYYDIGIAVGAEEGLVVPVLRDAESKSFAQIEQEIADLAKRARENKLTLEELMGGTFTITNGGIYGSLLSTPILNPPQVGILGLHKIQERPVAVKGQVEVRSMMYVALSYDHRVVDGREAVQFLVRLKELVEDPETLLLEG